MADNPKPASPHYIRGQAEIHNVKQIEKLRPEFHHSQIALPALPERRILDQRKIKLLEPGSAKSITSQRSELPLIRPSPSRHVQRNNKERAVVSAQPEITLLPRPVGGQGRHRNQVRPIRPSGACAC